jgi:hypothetical protein
MTDELDTEQLALMKKVNECLLALCAEYKGKEVRVFFTQSNLKKAVSTVWNDALNTVCVLEYPGLRLFLSQARRLLCDKAMGTAVELTGTPWEATHDTLFVSLGVGDRRKKEQGWMFLLNPIY